MNSCNSNCEQGKRRCPCPSACMLPDDDEHRLTLTQKLLVVATVLLALGGIFSPLFF